MNTGRTPVEGPRVMEKTSSQKLYQIDLVQRYRSVGDEYRSRTCQKYS